MANNEYLIQSATLTDICDAIREKEGSSGAISTSDIGNRIRDLKIFSPPPPNGTEWTQSNIVNGDFQLLEYGNGVWVAAQRSGDLYYSTNGKSWTACGVGSKTWLALSYGRGIWTASTSNSGILYSTDGINWTQSSVSGTSVSKIVFVGDYFFAHINSSYISYSSNGATWNYIVDTSNFRFITFGNGMYLLGIADTMYYSPNGRGWSQCTINYTSSHNGAWNYAYWNGYFWFAVDCHWSLGTVYYSNDGITWNPCSNISDYKTMATSIGIPYYLKIIEGRLFITGENNATWYCDGLYWHQCTTSDSKYLDISSSINSFKGKYIACGSNISFSEKGTAWQSNIISSSGNNKNRICIANGVCVSLDSSNGVYYSIDGLNWTLSNLTTIGANASVKYAEDIWVIATSNGIFYSIAWEQQS